MKKSLVFCTAFAAFFLAGAGTNALAGDDTKEGCASAKDTRYAETKAETKKDCASAKDTQPAETTETKVEAEAEEEQPSLFVQLGGEAAVKAAVDGFYDKVLADDRVNGFFKGVDMERQRRMQTGFLTFAFGGPSAYNGKSLRAAHAHLVAKGLNDTHFDIILEHLATTLKELGVKDELIQQAADVANSVRNDVLGKEEAPESEE